MYHWYQAKASRTCKIAFQIHSLSKRSPVKISLSWGNPKNKSFNVKLKHKGIQKQIIFLFLGEGAFRLSKRDCRHHDTLMGICTCSDQQLVLHRSHTQPPLDDFEQGRDAGTTFVQTALSSRQDTAVSPPLPNQVTCAAFPSFLITSFPFEGWYIWEL